MGIGDYNRRWRLIQDAKNISEENARAMAELLGEKLDIPCDMNEQLERNINSQRKPV